MLSALSVDDKDGTAIPFISDALGRDVASASGLVGVGPLREDRRVRPQGHGALDLTRWEDGRTIPIEGVVVGASQELAYENLREITTACLQTLDEGPALLKWREGASGLELQRSVRLASEIDPPIEEGAAVLRYQVQFFAEDPRAYSQGLTTVSGAPLSSASGGMVMPFTFPFTFAPSGGGIASFTNAGNRPTPVVFRIHGQLTNPTVVHLETQKRIALVGTVNAGDYLEIGTDPQGNRYVLLNGSVSQLNFLDTANSDWFELPAGSTSNMRLIAGTFDSAAFLEVSARSAYA